MPKGDACKSPVCRLCGEAHRIEAGLVCPKFRRAKPHAQPKLLALPAPPKPDKPAKAKPMKKAKKATNAKSVRTAALVKAMNTNKLISDAKVLKAATPKSKTPPKRKEYLKLKARERRAAEKAGMSIQDYRAQQVKP